MLLNEILVTLSEFIVMLIVRAMEEEFCTGIFAFYILTEKR
jgi:hypothetical protein